MRAVSDSARVRRTRQLDVGSLEAQALAGGAGHGAVLLPTLPADALDVRAVGHARLGQRYRFRVGVGRLLAVRDGADAVGARLAGLGRVGICHLALAGSGAHLGPRPRAHFALDLVAVRPLHGGPGDLGTSTYALDGADGGLAKIDGEAPLDSASIGTRASDDGGGGADGGVVGVGHFVVSTLHELPAVENDGDGGLLGRLVAGVRGGRKRHGPVSNVSVLPLGVEDHVRRHACGEVVALGQSFVGVPTSEVVAVLGRISWLGSLGSASHGLGGHLASAVTLEADLVEARSITVFGVLPQDKVALFEFDAAGPHIGGLAVDEELPVPTGRLVPAQHPAVEGRGDEFQVESVLGHAVDSLEPFVFQ